MNNKTIGDFIQKLRKEKGLTQEALALLIPIGREAISKWERGKNKPNKSCLEKLSTIFNVSIEELLLGRKLLSQEEQDDFVLDLFEDRNKKLKLFYLSLFFIAVILIMFLGYYFINTFNSIKVYTINYSDNNITISNGIFIATREKMYFRLGDISSNKEIKELHLYYKDINDKNNLICETDNLNVVLYDYNGYNLYFDYYKVKSIIDNIYLDIYYLDDIYTIKLEVKKDFANNKLFYDVKEKSSESSLFFEKNEREKIKKVFKLEDDSYVLKKDKFTFTYIEDADLMILTINSKTKEEWYYYINGDLLEYREYKDDKIINSFTYNEKEFICSVGNCSNAKIKKDYFLNEIKELL